MRGLRVIRGHQMRGLRVIDLGIGKRLSLWFHSGMAEFWRIPQSIDPKSTRKQRVRL